MKEGKEQVKEVHENNNNNKKKDTLAVIITRPFSFFFSFVFTREHALNRGTKKKREFT